MGFNDVFVIILIFSGIVFLFLSLLKVKKLFDLLFQAITSEFDSVEPLFKMHSYLIMLFLFGYFFVIVSTVFEIHLVNKIIVGFILFFWSIFVWVGAILQSKMLTAMKKSHLETIRVLISAVEARDPYTMGHSEHVANLLLVLFDALPKEFKKDINSEVLRYTGYLHDIGKIGIPESILGKKETLENGEWELLKKHAKIGEGILNNVEGLKQITEWISYHHERVDGEGYNKMEKDEIPFVSKMIAITDTYSALVTDRLYRKRKTYEEAIEIIKEIKSIQLDEDLVDTFCSIDKNTIENCKPKRILLENVKRMLETERFIEGYLKDHISREVLNRDAGIACLKKILYLSKREGIRLTAVELRIPGIKEKKEKDYHIADHNTRMVGELLENSVRKSDIVCRMKRDTFMIIFPKCSVKQSERSLSHFENKLLESNLLANIKNEEIIIKISFKYEPEKEESFLVVMSYVNSLQ